MNRARVRAVKIATFNANSVRARLDIILAWLEENRPDVLCIQETKAQDPDFPADAFSDAGYNVVFKGEKSYNGVATASLTKPNTVRFGLDDGEPPDETRFCYTRIGPVHIVNTYVPQGRETTHEMYQYKLQWFRRLRSYFERNFTTRKKVLWTGDLNVAPEPEDIYDPKQYTNHVCFEKRVRKAFADTKDWGFVDVFRAHHPEPGHFTFFDYRSIRSVERRTGWRIDHMLATPSLARKSTDSYIDIKPRLKKKPSDHTFLVAEFDV